MSLSPDICIQYWNYSSFCCKVIMDDCIKLSFLFPKPYEQLNQQNYRAKRREAWRRVEIKDGRHEDNIEAVSGKCNKSLAAMHILRDRHEDLKELLENAVDENILMTTKLELGVKTTKKKSNLHGRGNVTANIRLVHLAVIKRRHKCLEVMLNILNENKRFLSSSVLEPVTLLNDNYDIKKENFDEEVKYHLVACDSISFFI